MKLGCYIAVINLKCVITWEHRLALHLPNCKIILGCMCRFKPTCSLSFLAGKLKQISF